MAGFTRSYRDKWVNPVFRNLLEAGIWAWMCDAAAWKKTRVRHNGVLVDLERGQLITTIRFISSGFGIGEQVTRTFLENIEKDGMVNTLTNTRGTIITICNYDKYQQSLDESNTPDNEQLTNSQQTANTNKKELNKDKEGKESKKESLLSDFDELWKMWKPISTDKGSKKKAYSSYAKARKKTDHETIIRGAENYMRSCHASGRYTLHVATWLNQCGWEDDYSVTPISPGKPIQPRQPAGNGATSYERGIMASLARAQDPDYGDEIRDDFQPDYGP